MSLSFFSSIVAAMCVALTGGWALVQDTVDSSVSGFGKEESISRTSDTIYVCTHIRNCISLLNLQKCARMSSTMQTVSEHVHKGAVSRVQRHNIRSSVM